MQRPSFTRGWRLFGAARRLAVALFCLPLTCLLQAPAAGAEPSSLVELQSFSIAEPPSVRGLSSDGSTAFGSSRVDDGLGFSVGTRAVRWNATGAGIPLPPPVSTTDADRPTGTAASASADGSVVVGFSDRYALGVDAGKAALLWATDGAVELRAIEADAQGREFAEATDVSADGAIICGTARRFDPSTQASGGQSAVRWNASGDPLPMTSLGSDELGRRFSWARSISGDGTTIGGVARRFDAQVFQGDLPVLWAADGSITQLPLAPAGIAAKSGAVNALSFDGSRAFGTLDSDTREGEPESPVAVLWKNAASPIAIGPRTAFGDFAPFSDVVVGCSESGTRAVGYASRPAGTRGFVWTEGEGTIDLGTPYRDGSNFVGTSSPRAISGDGSTIVGRATDGSVGEAFVWRDGQMRTVTDAIEAAGVDLAAEGWESLDDAVACSFDGSVIVGIGHRDDGRVVGYRAKINDAPTVAPPTPLVVECTGGKNLVELAATANDANSVDRLTVIWKVDGASLKETPNVVPGSVVKFIHDYSDGPHVVSVEVSDGVLGVSSNTTVTVVDTTAPTIVVTPDIVVSTDPGKAHATGVVLSPPSVADLCDGEPRLTNDAPLVFPLGRTIVRWRAEDDEGNVAVAGQRVTVVDQEKPRLTGPRDVTVRCDRGQTFATVQLPPAQATDNVPQGLKVRSTAPARHPIGASTATWTATDAAGNTATWSTKVTVLNAPPVANAGKNVTITAKSERGARVTLSGSKSSDPDGHSLTYRWSAPGVRFAAPTKAKSAANFPVGSKTVKLTVTDEAGARKVDSVRVTVKLKNAKRRPRGAASNAAFAEAALLSTGRPSSQAPDPCAASGLLYAAAAHRLGIELGEHVRWEEGESPDAALLRYAERRELQRRHGEMAARRFLASFLEKGDEASLLAGLHAIRGVAQATEDLLER